MRCLPVVILADSEDWATARDTKAKLEDLSVSTTLIAVPDINKVLHAPPDSFVVITINACRSWYTVTRLLKAGIPVIPLETPKTIWSCPGVSKNHLFHNSISVGHFLDLQKAIEKMSETEQITEQLPA